MYSDHACSDVLRYCIYIILPAPVSHHMTAIRYVKYGVTIFHSNWPKNIGTYVATS